MSDEKTKHHLRQPCVLMRLHFKMEERWTEVIIFYDAFVVCLLKPFSAVPYKSSFWIIRAQRHSIVQVVKNAVHHFLLEWLAL